MADIGTKRELEGNSNTDTQKVLKKRRQCRVDNCFSDFGHIHNNFTSKLLKEVATEIRSISDEDCSSLIKINPLFVLNSNAPDGYPFSRAFCRIAEIDEEYSFACLFKKGLQILMKYLDVQEMPSNHQESLVLDTLLHYLIKMTNEDAQAPFHALEELGETDIAIILTNHLFGELSTSSHFLIDKQCKGKGERASCPCSNAESKVTGSFGDTAIGNTSVWHGNLNVVVNNQVVVEASEDKPYSDSSEKTPPMEVKIKSAQLSKKSQILAKTIVFSFLQKKRHPECSQYLFPCIAVNGQNMVVYFYDSEHDVLLQSSPIPLHVTPKSLTGHVSLVAIVVSWLVLNHQYLCDGLTDRLQEKTSGFFYEVEETLSIYQNELQFGNVGVPCPSKPKHQYSLVSDPLVKEIEEDRIQIILRKTLSRT